MLREDVFIAVKFLGGAEGTIERNIQEHKLYFMILEKQKNTKCFLAMGRLSKAENVVVQPSFFKVSGRLWNTYFLLTYDLKRAYHCMVQFPSNFPQQHVFYTIYILLNLSSLSKIRPRSSI